VDVNGSTAAYYEYDPCGNAIQAAGSHCNINPLRYRGYYYDSELQMQLSFERGINSYVVLDGTVVPCACRNDRGSEYIGLLCQANVNEYEIGDFIFWGRYVDLSDDTFVLKDRKTRQIYTFVRVDQST
jgi:hypothetical protein